MREQIPLMLAFFTGLVVAGGYPAMQGTAGSQVVDVIRVATVSALTVVVLVVAVLIPFQARAEKLKTLKAAPRPRWQYLLMASGWLFGSACWALAGRQLGTGYLSRACFALALWSGVFGLAVLGRSASWGRLRNLFWWHGPTWLGTQQVDTRDRSDT